MFHLDFGWAHMYIYRDFQITSVCSASMMTLQNCKMFSNVKKVQAAEKYTGEHSRSLSDSASGSRCITWKSHAAKLHGSQDIYRVLAIQGKSLLKWGNQVCENSCWGRRGQFKIVDPLSGRLSAIEPQTEDVNPSIHNILLTGSETWWKTITYGNSRNEI